MGRIRAALQRLLFEGSARKRRILLAVGVAGILLIAASELLPRRSTPQEEPTDTATLSASQVEQALEERITALLSRTEGVGQCQVMVTLEHGAQFVYATDQSTTATAGEQTSGSEKTLVVETDAGPVGLLVTEVQPAVKGVAVICDGGGDPAVQERVSALVTAALDISARRVCVAKRVTQ